MDEAPNPYQNSDKLRVYDRATPSRLGTGYNYNAQSHEYWVVWDDEVPSAWESADQLGNAEGKFNVSP